jgi:hypothetical protein
VSEVNVDRRAGLFNVVDIVIAPKTAFERLRVVPTWVWAFVAATLLAVAGSLLVQPATQHAIATGMPAQLAANKAIQRLPAARQQAIIAQQLGIMKTIAQISWLLVPFLILVTGVVQAVVMTIANAIARGRGTFAQYFAVSQTVAVVGTGLAALVLGIIVAIRGAASFDDFVALQSAMPGLGLLAPGAHGALRGFLGGLTIFNLWAAALLAYGMIVVGRLPRTAAWIAAAIMLLAAAGYAAYGGAQQG